LKRRSASDTLGDVGAVQTIIVGYDSSEAAERALERAAEIATAFGSRLIVVAVADPGPSLADPSMMPVGGVAPLPPPVEPVDPSAGEAHARRQLERARTLLAPHRVDVDYVSAVGDPAESLLRAADERTADLIVIGSREHGFLERLLGGGVDEQLARSAHRDVLLVH
jgi:nucleotide-binding universal stress UspA family protein